MTVYPDQGNFSIELAQAVTLLACIREVSCSNLGWDDYTDYGFWLYSSVLQENHEITL
jgi:hypothetical protein